MESFLNAELCTTTFLVSNLHCQSCIRNIESTLSTLLPKPSLISHSFASGSITVRHDLTLWPYIIIKSLSDAGLDIRQAVQDGTGDGRQIPRNPREEDPDEEVDLLEQAFNRWKRSQPSKALEERTAAHIRHCDLCRSKGKLVDENKSSPAASGVINRYSGLYRADSMRVGLTSQTQVVVDNIDSLVPVRVTASIVGMTCGTCVGRISEALEAQPWSRSVDISLLSNSATIALSDIGHVKDAIEKIESIGYEAAVESVEELKDSLQTSKQTLSGLYRASYSIGGMTCSTCIGTINHALRCHQWIRHLDINLISNSAVVVYEGEHHLDQITDSIENVGYDAVVNDVARLNPPQHQDRWREVLIRVAGMYCENCLSRVYDSLAEDGQNIIIERTLTLNNPIVKVRYMPNAPSFTIRDILASASTRCPDLELSIYHAPTLEERSRAIHSREQRRLLLRVGLSVTVAIPTFIIAIAIGSLAPSESRVRQFFATPIWSGQATRADWALFMLATPVYFLAADIFHRRALREIWAMWRRGSPTPVLQRFYRFGSMNTLMSLGTSIAYLSSIAQLVLAATNSTQPTYRPGGSTYFDSVAFLTMLLLIGKLIESYSRSKTGDAVNLLGSLRPAEALLVTPRTGENHPLQSGDNMGSTQKVSVDLVELGDIILVPHGSSPPWDGSVVGEGSEFDESALTGESKLVRKQAGDEVFSGSINRGRPLSICITGMAGDSMLDQIIHIVREGQARRAPVERLADILTAYFVPCITLIAISTWVIWLSLGLSGVLPGDYLDISRGGWPLWSLQFAIAVFIIACPCGIALAAPTALFVGGGIAAQNGILVKGGGEAFQEASQLDCVVFDKTGTLTQGGEPVVTNHVSSGDNPGLIRSLILRLEESSSHPIAKAIAAFYKTEHLPDCTVKAINEIPGKGMKGTFTNETGDVDIMIGSEALMGDYGVDLDNRIGQNVYTWRTKGKSIAIVASKTGSEWTLEMGLAISDPLRPEARATIEALRRRNIGVWMISGDNITTAAAVGDVLGIYKDNIIAGVLPGQKADKVHHLQKSLSKREGHHHPRTGGNSKRATVAMVGDGINDSPALAVADVGIAIGSGSDVAISSADFILVSPQLESVLTLIDLSRAVMTRIRFNFGWALVYNLFALPIAAGVLYAVKSGGHHIRLDPVWASLAMALSSVSVVCSSLLLKSKIRFVGFQGHRRRESLASAS